MSLDSDVIVDRRRIRRKLTFWRVFAAVVAIAAVVAVGVIATPSGRASLTSSGSIARVNIEGLIRSDQDRVEALDRLAKSNARAVIVAAGGANYGSLREACRRVGVDADVCDDPARIRNATHVILPGVGAAAQAMVGLRERGLDRVLQSLDQPLLGICLGMQLLFDASEESKQALCPDGSIVGGEGGVRGSVPVTAR